MAATHRVQESRAVRVQRVLVLPLTAVVGAAVALPVLWSGAAQADGTVSATVVLRTASSAEALAETGDLARSARLSRLSATMPTAATEDDVVGRVHALGLAVDAQNPWSLVVHGSASAVGQLGDLAGVSSVLLDGGPAPVPATPVPLTGAQLRTGYQTSSAAPPAGSTRPIVATLQFAPWDSSELAGYVTNANQVTASSVNPHPVALPALPAGEYTAVSVDGSPTTPGAGGFGGSGEVALDQESLYATDPYALQRAYFAQPSPAGLVAALDRVAVDAENMPALVALSISWTWCETGLSNLSELHTALSNVVAAGVTVFAASGDDGKFCNGGTTPADAYPASDPLTIAVGGTQLDLAGPTESGWEVADSSRPSGVFGSGGGPSKIFPSPSWQTDASGGNASRVVPDIASSASADAGFYSWHDAGDGLDAGFQLADGTSFASPASAGLYAAELGSRGAVNGGLGDLHSALYSAPAGTFRDIVTSPAVFGQFTAKPGYDMVTGLGAPLWSKVVDRLLTQPVISVPATMSSRVVPVTVTAPAGQDFLAWTHRLRQPARRVRHLGRAARQRPAGHRPDRRHLQDLGRRLCRRQALLHRLHDHRRQHRSCPGACAHDARTDSAAHDGSDRRPDDACSRTPHHQRACPDRPAGDAGRADHRAAGGDHPAGHRAHPGDPAVGCHPAHGDLVGAPDFPRYGGSFLPLAGL